MLPFIDNLIEHILTRYLHKRRDELINKTIKDYGEKHNLDEGSIEHLRGVISLEIDRVFAIADSSIIHARIHQARYAFWITSIVGTSIVLSLASFPVTTSIAPFFAPLITSFIAWVVYTVTIPVNYHGRVQGAINSALVVFEKQLNDHNHKNALKLALTEVQELRGTVQDMQQQIVDLRKQIKQLASESRSEAKTSRSVLPGITLWQAGNENILKDDKKVDSGDLLAKPIVMNVR